MSDDYPSGAKIVSPAKCNEKPWDLWVGEIGHLSPRRDDEDTFATPQTPEGKGGASRRMHDSHPYKQAERQPRYRRAGLHRLKYESMSLHGLFPQMDTLNAAVCHMCGVVVKCSAAYRHLMESHTGTEPILPPPPPTTTVRNRSRHKKEPPPPPPPPPVPVEILPVKMETSPVHTATAPLSRIVLPQSDLQFMDEPSTSTAVTGEVQVCVESGELPVVSIQDTDELPLGDNLTDDIFAIMNSEGIQSADDITNAADWKNIIRDIGNMSDLNFCSTNEPSQTPELYTPVHSSLNTYTLTDSDLTNLQFGPSTSPMLSSALETNIVSNQALKPATPSTPSSKARSKNSKSKFNLREYDPNKHCGVTTAENPKPCTRSLTCKAHALSLRRMVEGRAKPFDTLLAEHRASRDSAAAPPPPPPPLLVNPSIDLSAFNSLTTEEQVDDIYASLLGVDDANSVLPDTSSITSLLSQPLPDAFLLPDDAVLEEPAAAAPPPEPEAPPPPARSPEECPPTLVPTDVSWYAANPRPLALCTFNTSHAGSAIMLGKRFATVRSNIKSSLSRSQCKTVGGSNNSYYNQSAMSLTKSIHMNSNKPIKPEVRKLIVTCSATSGGNSAQETLNELFGAAEVRHDLNGHVGKRALKPAKRAPQPMLDLGFSLDPLLADEKC